MAKKKKGCSAKKEITIRNKRGKKIATFRGRSGLDCPKRRNPPKGKTPARLRPYVAVMKEVSPGCFRGSKTTKAARKCVGAALKLFARSNR